MLNPARLALAGAGLAIAPAVHLIERYAQRRGTAEVRVRIPRAIASRLDPDALASTVREAVHAAVAQAEPSSPDALDRALNAWACPTLTCKTLACGPDVTHCPGCGAPRPDRGGVAP